MPSFTLQAQSKKQRLVDLGHAITTRARSQRYLRPSRTKTIWKTGLNKARRHWNRVRKNKRSTRREAGFDSMYPIGHISSPIPQFLSDQMLDYTPQPSPMPSQTENSRNSAAFSVALTTQTSSNSQMGQRKRQSQYKLHEAAEPSPLFYDRPHARPSGVLFSHPLATVVGGGSNSPYTARTSSNYESGPSGGSDEWSTRWSERSEYILSDYSPDSTPQTSQFPGQVNPNLIAKKRQSEELTALSNDILDGHLPSNRDQLFSQRGCDAQKLTLLPRPASMPPQTPSLSKAGNAATRPVTTFFAPGGLSPVQENPEPKPRRDTVKRESQLPHIPYPGDMSDVRESIYAISGSQPQQPVTNDDAAAVSSVPESPINTPLTDGFTQGPQVSPLAYPGTTDMSDLTQSIIGITGKAKETQHVIAQNDIALALLEGKLPPIREPSQIADSEADAQIERNQDMYPGSTKYRESRYESYQPGKKLKGRPVPAVGMGRSRPATPATPQRSSKGKQAADSNVQRNLAKARKEVDDQHNRLSKMHDRCALTPPMSITGASWSTDSASESPGSISYILSGHEFEEVAPTPPVTASQPPLVTRKPLAKQPSQNRPDTAKPLPKLPQQTSTSSHPRQQPEPNRPQPSSRITVLEQRIAALETQLARKTPVSAAAAGARAAATLHSAMVAGSSVPRGPHRARPSRKRDIHHEQAQAKEPSAGSILRDMVKGRFF